MLILVELLRVLGLFFIVGGGGNKKDALSSYTVDAGSGGGELGRRGEAGGVLVPVDMCRSY